MVLPSLSPSASNHLSMSNGNFSHSTTMLVIPTLPLKAYCLCLNYIAIGRFWQGLKSLHLGQIHDPFRQGGDALQKGQAVLPKRPILGHHQHFVKEGGDGFDHRFEGGE